MFRFQNALTRNGNMVLQLVLPSPVQNGAGADGGGYFNAVNEPVGKFLIFFSILNHEEKQT